MKGESLEYSMEGPGEPKPRRYFRVWEGGGVRFALPNNDLTSVLHAIIERVFYVKKEGVFQRPPIFQASVKRVAHFLKGVSDNAGMLFPCTPEEFCDRYVGNKRRLYDNARKSLMQEGLIWRDSIIRMFTKAEYLKPGGTPRAIQPRSPRYNVCLGCFLSPNEHTIFKAINEYFVEQFNLNDDHITIAKGMNMRQRGQAIAKMWEEYHDPVSIGLDAARFDQHINEDLLQLEHALYLKLFGNVEGPVGDVKLSTLLKWQRRNTCVWSDKENRVQYKTKGCRMSGDMNTSLGNIVIMTMLWAVFQRETSYRFHMLNDGDDSCIVCSRKTAKKIVATVEEFFLEFGITMVVEGVFDSLEEITFCQAKPVFDGKEWYLCSNPHKRLFSDMATTKDISSPKILQMLLGSVSACGLACNGNTPVLNELYRKLGTGVDLFIPDKSHFLYKYRQELVDGLTPRFEEPTYAHRLSFYRAFCIAPQEQLLLEKFIRELPTVEGNIVTERGLKPLILDLLDPVFKESDDYEDLPDGLPADILPGLEEKL